MLFDSKNWKGDYMETIRCKKCGRPLRDPDSIARGMGPECAGITGSQKDYMPGRKARRNLACLQENRGSTSPTLFTLVRKDEQTEEFTVTGEEALSGALLDVTSQFPADLLNLVLSAPPPGAIASRDRHFSNRKKKGSGAINPGKALREIRRMCIDIRLAFWPGISDRGRPVACVPFGEDDWKFENTEKVLSRAELESYLARFGMISPAKETERVSATGSLRFASNAPGQEA